MPPEMPISAEQQGGSARNNHRFFRLWVIVSLLWTAATLLRVWRVWIPVDGLNAVLTGPWLWLELALPPLMVGSMILVVRQVARNPRVLRPPWRHPSS